MIPCTPVPVTVEIRSRIKIRPFGPVSGSVLRTLTRRQRPAEGGFLCVRADILNVTCQCVTVYGDGASLAGPCEEPACRLGVGPVGPTPEGGTG